MNIETYTTPAVRIVLLTCGSRLLAGSPENPGGSIDPFIFEEDEQ